MSEEKRYGVAVVTADWKIGPGPTLSDLADDDDAITRDLARDLIAANAELHKRRNGHQLGGMMEDLNAMQARAVEAEARIQRASAAAEKWYQRSGHIDPQDARRDCANEMLDVLEGNFPTKTDGHLANNVLCAKRARIDSSAGGIGIAFDDSFCDELEKRGYDITTLRLSVKRFAKKGESCE